MGLKRRETVWSLSDMSDGISKSFQPRTRGTVKFLGYIVAGFSGRCQWSASYGLVYLIEMCPVFR